MRVHVGGENHASMRPPNCFGGNPRRRRDRPGRRPYASMRPPNCFGGNHRARNSPASGSQGFNEAAELLRRKLVLLIYDVVRVKLLQ